MTIKRSLLVASLLTLAWLEPVAANEAICAASKKAAQSIMAVRQAGYDKSLVVGIARAESNPQARQIAFGLIDAAYMEPIHVTPRDKSAAEERFANLTYEICMKELN